MPELGSLWIWLGNTYEVFGVYDLSRQIRVRELGSDKTATFVLFEDGWHGPF